MITVLDVMKVVKTMVVPMSMMNPTSSGENREDDDQEYNVDGNDDAPEGSHDHWPRQWRGTSGGCPWQ